MDIKIPTISEEEVRKEMIIKYKLDPVLDKEKIDEYTRVETAFRQKYINAINKVLNK